MKGMILSAGLGTRMGALTKNTPKPLLRVGKKTLIEYRIDAFVSWGIREVLINLYYLGKHIEAHLGDGSRYGASITYAYENTLLDVGGSIVQARPFFAGQCFMVVSADIWTDFTPSHVDLPQGILAHLMFVPNPWHHKQGDYVLDKGHVKQAGATRLTYGNIGLFHPDFFIDAPSGALPLRTLLDQHISRGVVTGERYDGPWINVGTPERLAAARACYHADNSL